MTFRRSLRVLFSVSLFVVVFVPFAIAAEPETAAQKGRVAASCQRCGDGYCAPSCENERTCPKDCLQTKLVAPVPEPEPAPAVVPAKPARCGRCGDGQCVKSCGETAQSCPADCGGGGEPSAASSKTDKPSDCAPSSDGK